MSTVVRAALARTPPEHELNAALLRLPDWRQRKAASLRRPSDRAACIASWLLLEGLWHDLQGNRPLPRIHPAASGQLLVEPDGGPWRVSLSHRDGWCAAALATADVGIDVCSPIAFDGDLLTDWTSTQATRWERHLRCQDNLAPVWARMEALAKLDGRGLTNRPRLPDPLPVPVHCWQPQGPTGPTVALAVAADDGQWGPCPAWMTT